MTLPQTTWRRPHIQHPTKPPETPSIPAAGTMIVIDGQAYMSWPQHVCLPNGIYNLIPVPKG